MKRTDAILRALDEADQKSLHRKLLTEALVEHGRGDSIEHVSAALAYLQKEKKVTALGQGWWRLGPPHLYGAPESGQSEFIGQGADMYGGAVPDDFPGESMSDKARSDASLDLAGDVPD